MQVFALKEGCFSVDATKRFIPFDSTIHQAKDRPASLFIHVNPFLVKTRNHLILFDSGLGFDDELGTSTLQHHIRQLGFDPADVDLVLMSHLHNDHTGGLVHHGVLTFPKAIHVMQKADWEHAISHPYYEKERLDTIGRFAKIAFVNGVGHFDNGLSYELTGGHCPFHQVWKIEEDGETIFFGGDILPEPEQLLRKFLAKYDFEPQKALELRLSYGEKAANEQWKCLFYHAKTTPIGTVKFQDGQFSFQTVE